jgi:hypothetical protein
VYGNARLEINNTSYKALLFDEFYGDIFLDKFEKALAMQIIHLYRIF